MNANIGGWKGQRKAKGERFPFPAMLRKRQGASLHSAPAVRLAAGRFQSCKIKYGCASFKRQENSAKDDTSPGSVLRRVVQRYRTSIAGAAHTLTRAVGVLLVVGVRARIARL